MLDVACVCVGDKYQPELHVKQLYTALHKHLQQPFQFNVITDCPDHSFYKTIYFDVANYYFENEKYSYAYKWFLKADRSKISLQSLPKYYFNKGYTFFLKKKYNEAKELFENVKNDPKYESDAHYYLGHISYQLEDYESEVITCPFVQIPVNVMEDRLFGSVDVKKTLETGGQMFF